ncbi:MAG: CoA-binding protein [Candidatus Aenigmarchaeota archaeon]|nr:CoA-binding protein [Candidatus Aenigmarchaeota archaeon]
MDGDFLNKENVIAVIGATENKKKWGYKIYKKLKGVFRRVYPVNPKYGKIYGDKCYPGLKSLPEKPDLVITVVPPSVTEKVVEVCGDMNIRKVWMQPGSESEKAINMCREMGIECMHDACFVVDGMKESFKD